MLRSDSQSGKGRYHWSNAAHEAKFIGLNAITFVPVLMLILNPTSKYALFAAIATVVFFVLIEYVFGMNLIAFIRLIKSKMTGRVKTTHNIIREIFK